MTSWHSYPKIYNLGHAALKSLFDGPTLIEEKIDGSFFAFGVFNGQLQCRSKGREFTIGHQDKMFNKAVESVVARQHLLKEGWMYCGEFLGSPGHNTLVYSRVPKDHIILFDIKIDDEQYLNLEEKIAEAARIDLEVVPSFQCVKLTDPSALTELMQRESVLGGPKMEGLVFKNYTQFGTDKKALFGKHVSESFKESHRAEWKVKNPMGLDVIQALITAYKTEARWQKAFGRLRDDGKLTNSPKDIGPLIGEIQKDTYEECHEEIKEYLFKWAWPKISRAISGGAPEWYKNKLMESQFATQADIDAIPEEKAPHWRDKHESVSADSIQEDVA